MTQRKSKTWLTADWHLGHKNIIEFCNRPFDSCEEMNRTIVENLRSILQPNDTIYFLGDLTFKRRIAFLIGKEFGSQMHFIFGNHDKKSQKFHKALYKSTQDMKTVKYQWKGQPETMVLCHYPMRVWDKKHWGAFHFHGHSHGRLDPYPMSLDVGVDNAYKLLKEYRPFSLEEARDWARRYVKERNSDGIPESGTRRSSQDRNP